MISPQEFLASEQAKKLPTWIKNDPRWCLPINKVFPELGLQNCRGSCEEMITPLVPYNKKPDGSFAAVPAPTPVKMDIVFSSDGIDGLWDIATMSMRGALSCKHWANDHSRGIVSEITNPNIGIIYLTDGTMTEYGLSINKRALVRFCKANASWGGIMSDRIYLDRIYTKTTNTNPLVYLNVDPDAYKIMEIFKKFIESKLTVKAVVSYS